MLNNCEQTRMILFSQAQFQECWPPGSWQWMPSSMGTPLELYPVIRHSAATWGMSRYGTNGWFRMDGLERNIPSKTNPIYKWMTRWNLHIRLNPPYSFIAKTEKLGFGRSFRRSHFLSGWFRSERARFIASGVLSALVVMVSAGSVSAGVGSWFQYLASGFPAVNHNRYIYIYK